MKKMGSEILFSESFLKPENILFLFRQKHLQKNLGLPAAGPVLCRAATGKLCQPVLGDLPFHPKKCKMAAYFRTLPHDISLGRKRPHGQIQQEPQGN